MAELKKVIPFKDYAEIRLAGERLDSIFFKNEGGMKVW